MWFIYTVNRKCTQDGEHRYAGVRLGIPYHDFFGDRYLKGQESNYRAMSELDGIHSGEVVYDDEAPKRSPSQGSGIRITNVVDLGLYCKSTAWSFEEEARFYILQPTQCYEDVKELFVELKDSFFENLEIVFSPLMTDEQIADCESEIAALMGGDFRFTPSSLRGSVRPGS
jgi:hypothetical protein